MIPMELNGVAKFATLEAWITSRTTAAADA